MHISTKMRKEIVQEIEIPEGVQVTIDKNIVNIKGPKGEVKRALINPKITIKTEANDVIIEGLNSTKREKTRFFGYMAFFWNLAGVIAPLLGGVFLTLFKRRLP